MLLCFCETGAVVVFSLLSNPQHPTGSDRLASNTTHVITGLTIHTSC